MQGQGIPKLMSACWQVVWVIQCRLKACNCPGADVGPLMGQGLWLQGTGCPMISACSGVCAAQSSALWRTWPCPRVAVGFRDLKAACLLVSLPS